MSNITINVEFLAGTSVEEAVYEAREKARSWDVAYVCFNFNGVKCSIGPKADVLNAKEQIMQAMRNDKMKFVVCNS